MRRGICLLILLTVALMAGCAQHRRATARDDERLPPYAWADEQTALRDLAERSAAVRTASAACDLTLTRPDGESVRLDGAVALSPPDRLRLRAWKFSRAVFDLTLRPDGLWVLAPDDAGRRRQVLPAALDAATFGREWAFLFGGFFAAPDLEAQVRGDELVVRRTLPDGRSVVCDVDRATLTPRRYRMLDPAGQTRFTLVLEGYREFDGGLTFPTHFTATSDEGGIDVTLRDVELNQSLPDDAFVPPRRAERQP